jgi:hypothetical protein
MGVVSLIEFFGQIWPTQPYRKEQSNKWGDKPIYE